MSIVLADGRTVFGSFDFETHQFRPGLQAPPIVCASAARVVNGKLVGQLLFPASIALDELERMLLDETLIIFFANAPYDLAVAAAKRPHLLPLIFRALRAGRIHDILISQSLDQIYYGTLGVDPRSGGDLRSPSTGKTTKRYSLEIVHHQLTGKVDAKLNDTWRRSYALLERHPLEAWPEEAKTYPVDDAVNTLEDGLIQKLGKRGPHAWVVQPAIPGVVGEKTICKHCNGELTLAWPPAGSACDKAPLTEHKNQENLPQQVEAGFAAWLGACHSFRTDPEKVDILEADVTKKNEIFVERFKKKGWIRLDGTEDVAAVKKAVVAAYGVTGVCKRCGGEGKVQTFKNVECRGEKIKGRYQGCQGDACATCGGHRELRKPGSIVICKNTFDDEALAAGKSRLEALIEAGCDGTGVDVDPRRDDISLLPRSDGLGIKTNRDTLMESGDDELSDYGLDEFKKSITTYVPYLKTGISAPLKYSPNVLVSTGRYSYEESPLHQMPRKGKERECIRARGAWCGYPIEMVLGSTDYEAGELCTLSVYCYWVVGQSKMMEAINASGKPGILHSDLAAQVLGLSLDEFLVRLKAKDKQAVDFRQAAKPYMFGRPGLMGPPKIVFTSRGKNSGFTPCEGGPAHDDEGRQGYHGIRFCILIDGATKCGVEKITQWRKRPCFPVCKRCVEVVDAVLGAAYTKRYPEMPEYFDWVAKCLEKYENRVPNLVWDADAGKPRIVRWRGGDSENFRSAACNSGFQGMLGDVIKDAYVTMTRECYLGVTDEGESSPLYGCRVPLVIHDEPLSELILETAHLSGPRIADIMVASGKKIAPQVTWKAETALAHWWSKSMEPVYKDGKLVPWSK